jgi:hypothetical protein
MSSNRPDDLSPSDDLPKSSGNGTPGDAASDDAAPDEPTPNASTPVDESPWGESPWEDFSKEDLWHAWDGVVDDAVRFQSQRDQLADENQRLEEENEDLRLNNHALVWRLQHYGDDPSDVVSDATPVPDPEAPPEEIVPDFEPFPVEALPDVARRYVQAAAEALPTDPAMVGVPLLPVLAGAIGNRAHLHLKRSWREPGTLWTCVVAPSGSTKSPAWRHAVRPLLRWEAEAHREHERQLAEWNAQNAPDARDRPVRQRYRISDPTPEAAVQVLSEAQRGITLARDELGAWIGSFDRYTSGMSDLHFWIEVYEGTLVSRDRVGEGNTTVADPAVSVCGTIQPGTLKGKLEEVHFDTGFAQRVILCQPPHVAKAWTEADVTTGLQREYEALLRRLQTTPPDTTITMDAGAKAAWVDFYNTENRRIHVMPEGPARSVRSKGVTHAARLALVLHLCERANPADLEVSEATMRNALTLGQWLTNETLRVYGELSLDENALDPKLRFLNALPDEFKTAEARAIAEADGITERTLYRWLVDLQESGAVRKLKRGLYQKT